MGRWDIKKAPNWSFFYTWWTRRDSNSRPNMGLVALSTCLFCGWF